MRFLKTFAKWLVVYVCSMICFFLQYSFVTDTGEEYESFMFAGSIYSINYLTYSIGLTLFLVGYLLLWKYLLKPDWRSYNGIHWLWKVGYPVIVALVVVLLFYGAVLVMFLNSGFGAYKQEWLEPVLYVQLTYIVVLPVIDLLFDWWKSRKKTRKQNA